MSVYLKTNFMDYYDHMFDTNGMCFERMSENNFSRGDMFTQLAHMGLATPGWGSVRALARKHAEDTMIVVYTDVYAHRGEEKFMMSISAAFLQGYEGKLASLFVPILDNEVISFRYLRIGDQTFWMMYESDDPWRSNVGRNVKISLGGGPPLQMANYVDSEPHPLLAIDFVHCKYGGMLAVDYNTSPGLKGSPIEQELSATQVVDSIKKFMKIVSPPLLTNGRFKKLE